MAEVAVRSAHGESEDQHLLLDIARTGLARAGADDWRVELREVSCTVAPEAANVRRQGWKLHVSATPLSAPVVLSRVVAVLVRHRCPFKFVHGLRDLQLLVSNQVDRGSGGKFITAYPPDDETFERLAAELDKVTDGLPGPVILSDRSLRPGSLVHYRYGAFTDSTVLTNDGSYESMLVTPDGRHVKDQRLAWFSPPDWARSSLPASLAITDPKPDAAASSTGRAVLIGGRFLIREAIRHSYRGGVYLATDEETGAEVVVKQARPHVMSSLTGTDCRDAAQREADMLNLLAPAGISPKPVVAVVHQDNLFLVMERIPGVTLRRWVGDRVVDGWQGRGAPVPDALRMARRLAGLVAVVHEHNVVLRDLAPNNIMVGHDDRLCLVDLELAVREGTRAGRGYTPGYAAPEQTAAPWFGPVPERETDLYSLGATIFFLASGLDPIGHGGDPRRPAGSTLPLADFVHLVGTHMDAVRLLAPLILGLTQTDPSQRWNLSRTEDFLSHAVKPDTLTISTADASDVEGVADAWTAIESLVVDGTSQLLRTMTPDGARLWPDPRRDAATDACNVQHGAAGVLGVLIRAAQTLGGDSLRAGVATTAAWLDRQVLDATTRILPGLYFGRSGTAWALYDAARMLDDDRIASHAVDLIRRVPLRWPNPDICHGTAGAGMAHLHLWHRTRDADLEGRIVSAADYVLRAGHDIGGLLLWPIPETFDSNLAGMVDYGFAHGVAGAGTFLLYCAVVTGRPEYLAAACRAGDTLEAVADIGGDAAWWPSGQGRVQGPRRMRHWCSGSSGVGTFLIRLWSVTGDSRFRQLAEAAAAAVLRDRWYANTSACHGLAGDGDFLLDLADFTGGKHYRDQALELATVMRAYRLNSEGLSLLPDDTGSDVTSAYNTGLAGQIGFLLRLRHGGSRLWMVDDLLPDSDRRRRVPAAG